MTAEQIFDELKDYLIAFHNNAGTADTSQFQPDEATIVVVTAQGTIERILAKVLRMRTDWEEGNHAHV